MKQTKTKRKPLPITISQKDFVKILKEVRQPHHKVAMLLAFESGLRISEVLALRKECIDYDRKTLRIIEGKGGKDRIVPIPIHWEKELDVYLPIPCGKRSLQQAFMTYANRSGVRTEINNVHFHTLRHGFATRCRKLGMKIDQIQQLLGHGDLSTTMIYVNLDPMENIGDYYKKWS